MLISTVLGMCSKVSKSPNQAEDILLDMQNYADMDIKDVPTAFLVCEIFELILLNCLQVDQSLAFIELCLESTNKTINYMEMLTAGLIAVKDFASPCTSYEKLFKFGFPKINNTVSNYSGSIDNLYVIKCLCSFMGKKYESVLQILRENLKCTGSSLLCYLGALSCFMLEDLSQCLGFLNMSNGLECGGELKSRINILLGRALSRKGDHKKALKCFKEAVECSPHIPATYYYMGEEYGKMGLDDDMIECFQNLARVSIFSC